MIREKSTKRWVGDEMLAVEVAGVAGLVLQVVSLTDFQVCHYRWFAAKTSILLYLGMSSQLWPSFP